MKKFLLAAFFALWPIAAGAQIVTTLPFQLQNNTTADATQVMANFNQIVANVNANAATSGINSDITQLLGLTTPLSPSQGGTTAYVGGTSGGSANAQTVTTTAPTSFTLATGSRLYFVAGATNTAAMTLAVNAGTATAVYRRTSVGATALGGGEVISGNIVGVMYDGTRWQIISSEVIKVGQVIDVAGSTAPAGTLLLDGTCYSQTTYAALFAVIGTTYGSACGAGNFPVPDMRGRLAAGKDNMGGSAAGRIGTVSTDSGVIVGATLGSVGGSSTHIQTVQEMATHNHTVTDPGHFHAFNQATFPLDAAGVVPGSTLSGGNISANTSIEATGITIQNNGNSTAMSLLQPTMMLNKAIVY